MDNTENSIWPDIIKHDVHVWKYETEIKMLVGQLNLMNYKGGDKTLLQEKA